MGFYGNVTNTSNTTFSFDRIYPNRLAMDANTNNDGIFIGRYVLVEYQEDAAYPVVYIKDGKFYSSPNHEDTTRIRFLSGKRKDDADENNDGYFDGIYKDEFVQTQQIDEDKTTIKFYQCIGAEGEYAVFKEATPDNSKSNYITNFGIDEYHYSNEKGFKGYDSTVWVKSSVEQNGRLITKYVNIADLNSVVPTFDIAADAPTMTPITPHFDADNTNVYYKLHMQSPYGFRVKQGVEGQSDDDTIWYKTTYNKEEDETKTEIVYDGPADIYYNQAGFNPEISSKVSNKAEDNYIKLEPTGKSGTVYAHGGQAKDIQEFSLHLPAIGNMMSDAWDIIYGPKRDKARTDEDGSLQGRLDSFKAIEDNHIPIKRNDDGTIIGTAINGNNNYQMPNGKNILTTTHFPLTTNDPWIDVTIDNSSLQGGYDKKNKTEISQENNNAIRIRHSANRVDPTTTSWDKNGVETSINNSYNYYNIDTNINGEQDKIKLYVPYVDATGHVVGKNIETVTLPFGYKTFTTKGLAPLDDENKEIVEDLYTTINNQLNGNNTSSSSASASTSIANNTQDSIAIEPYNKWIQTQLSNDKLVIAHEVHAINTEKDTTDLNDLKDGKIQNEINIPDWDYDKAGHIKKKGEHTYTLPYGYKKIQTANSSGSGEAPAAKNTSSTYNTNTTEHVADTTQDTLKFSATNKWITMQADTSDDVIKFGHVLSPETVAEHHSTDTSVVTFGDSFNILNFDTDEAGHITRVGQTIITTPTGSLEDTISSNTANVLTSIKFTPSTGKIETTHQDVGTLKLGTTYTANKNGALTFDGENTINDALSAIQAHINESEYTESGTQYFIDSITQVDGKITTTRKGTAGTLIVGYDTTNKLIGKDDSVNTAFDTIDKAIAKEVSDRIAADAAEATARANAVTTEKNAREAADNTEKLAREAGDQAERAALNAAIEQEVSDRDDAISAAIAGLVDSAPDNLNTLQKIVKWIDADEDGAIDLATNVAKNAENISLLNTKLKSAAYETKETFVLKTDYDTKVASLEAVILDLTNRIAALETKMEDNHPTDEGEAL